jgi:hypothetical protein
MSTPVRVAAFVTTLVAVFAAALGLGRLAGPLDVEPTAAAHADDDGHGSSEGGSEPGAHEEATPSHEGDEAASHVPGGLMVSAEGFTLDLSEDRVGAGPQSVTFAITGPDGHPLTDYERTHEKQLHLIAVRRDFAGYQHVHPTMSPGGAWTADLDLSPGIWRLFADFVPLDGEALTLGTDLVAVGPASVAPAAPESRTSTVGDYTGEVLGDLAAGASSPVRLRVTRDGEPVTDLQPYLGAHGHLVALREGDLAYLHVHPESGDAGPEVPFLAEVPSVGRYRLFFDFKHDGVVRTASFVLAAEDDDDH